MDLGKIERIAKQERLAKARKQARNQVFPDITLDMILLPLLLTLSALMGLVITGLVTSIVQVKSQGWWLLVGAVTSACLAFATMAYLKLRVYKKEMTRALASHAFRPSLFVPEFLGRGVAGLREELMGAQSPFGRVCAEVEALNRRARVVSEQLASRCRQSDGTAFLYGALVQAKRVVESSGTNLERLNAFRAKVEAFLAECQGAIEGLTPTLQDLELVREVKLLAAEDERVETEVMQVINETLKTLYGRLEAGRVEALSQFHLAEVDLRREDPNKNPLLALEQLEFLARPDGQEAVN